MHLTLTMPYVPESWNSNASAKDKWQLSLSNYIFTAFLIFIDFIKAAVAQTVNAPVQIRNLMQQLQTIRPNNTIKKYQQYFNAWRKWATDLNVSFLPGNPLYIGLYILHKIQAGHSLPTMDAIFFAIKFYHITLLNTDPCQHSLVNNMFKAAKLLSNHKTDKKQALRPNELK